MKPEYVYTSKFIKNLRMELGLDRRQFAKIFPNLTVQKVKDYECARSSPVGWVLVDMFKYCVHRFTGDEDKLLNLFK